MNQARTLTEGDRLMLAERPEIIRVGRTGRIRWAPWFKREFTDRYARGETPTAIFRDHGLGPELIGAKRIERAAARWRNRPAARRPAAHGTKRRTRDESGPGRGLIDVIAAQSERINALERRIHELEATEEDRP
ncbi:hypothetical protein Uis1B_2220 [Bifidobacterium margollesii]|uniref:Uncharacterized protein n=1 Tax=Bifidobacterium margollesii TaxID=2020964 RepID=A0A2N5J6W1_9BIFI|nr:hypothetical protein [Bifidobacterium margollesii]PLS29952.1 hypothetical protein Uis1B_2220 [Bifidobacterium margollesii]